MVDDSGRVLRVSTCPFCLPAGAITWLIENGRQLDMFEPLLAPERGRKYLDIVRSVSEFDSYDEGDFS